VGGSLVLGGAVVRRGKALGSNAASSSIPGPSTSTNPRVASAGQQECQQAEKYPKKPKPVNVIYVRSDDNADMVEIGAHQVAFLDALLARRLMPRSIKAVEAAR
jgi:hypothetical protein